MVVKYQIVARLSISIVEKILYGGTVLYKVANDPASPKEKAQDPHASYSFAYRKCIKVSSERNDDSRPARPPEIYPAKYIQITAAHQRAVRWRSKGYLCT